MQLQSLPSPTTRLDVDGLIGGEGRAVGAGMAVAGDPLQRQELRVRRQTHPAQQLTHPRAALGSGRMEGGRDRGRGRLTAGGRRERPNAGVTRARDRRNMEWEGPQGHKLGSFSY